MPPIVPTRGFWTITRRTLAWLCLGVAVTGGAHADLEPTPKPTPEVIRDINYYFQHRERFDTPQPVNVELVVNYYDPSWRLLWAETEGTSLFLRASKIPMPITAGQRVRIRGTMSHEEGLTPAPDGVTVLANDKLPEPIVATDRLHDWSALTNRIVRVEGYVDRQEVIDERHVRLDTVVHGRRINVRVLTPGKPLPNVQGVYISALGVYTYTASTGEGRSVVEIWCGSPSQITIKDTLANDPRFDRPATPIERLSTLPSDELVRIVGSVHRHDPGTSMILRDNTGQATLLTAQSDLIEVGNIVEAIGYPSSQGATLQLTEAQYRALPIDGLPALRTDSDASQLRFIDQIQALTDDEAARGLDALITGVVTWTDPDEPFFYLQDATGGIRVTRPRRDTETLSFGAMLRVQGKVIRGSTQPELRAESFRRGADARPSAARALTLDQALSGVVEAQWIELTGFLREIKAEGRRHWLELTTASGEFSAEVAPFPRLASYQNSVVHIRGVCTSTLNEHGEASGVHLLVQSPDDIQVEAALPADLTSLPIQPIQRIHTRRTRLELNRWVRTQGMVTLHDPGNYLYLQDGAGSLRVLCRDSRPLQLGQRVDLVGLLGREAGKQVLREARILATAQGSSEPLPKVTATEVPNRDFDGLLATIRGTVVNIVDRSDQRRVIIQTANKLIECRFPLPERNALPEACEPGATIEATGVYHVVLDDYQQPRDFSLLLRTASDLAVIKKAPWWNLRRALVTSSFLGLLALLGIGWVALLRKRVSQQTQQILSQREKEALLEAELERSSRLESLGILAGGIAHDFNNMLTVIVGNITLAIMETPSDSKAAEILTEAENGALRARELTQQLLTFSRGGDPVRAPVRLPDIIREAAEFALRGSQVGSVFDFSPDLPPALADKGQINQAAHNLVAHAVQAMPEGGKVTLTLRETRVFDGDLPGLPGGKYLKLTVSDTGRGIPADHLGRIFDPYFSTSPNNNGLGLATVRSIVKRHQGHIEVASRINDGTTFTVWLPATEELPADEKVEAPTPGKDRGLRVLFMDDDDAIRRFAQNLLTRLGHQPTTVANGTEAVHAYASAWEEDKPFDVVVLDLTVAGGMGGKEALEHLQNIDPNVRAIVSSGYSSDPILADHEKYGFRGIVSKPYKIADLAEALQSVMRTGR